MLYQLLLHSGQGGTCLIHTSLLVLVSNMISLHDFVLLRTKFEIADNYISSRLHGLFYGALLCALFGVKEMDLLE